MRAERIELSRAAAHQDLSLARLPQFRHTPVRRERFELSARGLRIRYSDLAELAARGHGAAARFRPAALYCGERPYRLSGCTRADDENRTRMTGLEGRDSQPLSYARDGGTVQRLPSPSKERGPHRPKWLPRRSNPQPAPFQGAALPFELDSQEVSHRRRFGTRIRDGWLTGRASLI